MSLTAICWQLSFAGSDFYWHSVAALICQSVAELHLSAVQDLRLAKEVQQLFASPTMRVNTTSDVIGVELCGSLKNELAIAAGIVEGLDLGHNAMAALVTQGCSEIRWLAEKAGANSATISGLSGLGDIMLTCYGSLSRNRYSACLCARHSHEHRHGSDRPASLLCHANMHQ